MFCYICLQFLSTFFFWHFFKHFFSVFQSCTSFHIFFQLFFFPDFLDFVFFGIRFQCGHLRSYSTARSLKRPAVSSGNSVKHRVCCVGQSTWLNLTNVCFELDCWTRWTRWTVFWKKYLWVCSGMFWGWHWGRGPWWRPNEWEILPCGTGEWMWMKGLEWDEMRKAWTSHCQEDLQLLKWTQTC